MMLQDLYYEDIIDKDPTARVVLKGVEFESKKNKFLSTKELQLLIDNLDLENGVNYDWIIYLAAKTGCRFAEIIAITPNDINFNKQYIDINKTYDYKEHVGFKKTKTATSVRKVPIDWKTTLKLSNLVMGLPPNEPFLLLGQKIYNSTINDLLEKKCLDAGIPVISMHALRHTHGSVLLAQGISIASISKRLGHKNISTTQDIYLHVVKELEERDNEIITSTLSKLDDVENLTI